MSFLLLFPLVILSFLFPTFASARPEWNHAPSEQPGDKAPGEAPAADARPNSCHEAMFNAQAKRLVRLGMNQALTSFISGNLSRSSDEIMKKLDTDLSGEKIQEVIGSRFPKECSKADRETLLSTVGQATRVELLTKVWSHPQMSYLRGKIGDWAGWWRGYVEPKIGGGAGEAPGPISGDCHGALMREAGMNLMEEMAVERMEQVQNQTNGIGAIYPPRLGMAKDANAANVAVHAFDHPNAPPTLSKHLDQMFPAECTREQKVAYLRNYTARDLAALLKGNLFMARKHFPYEITKWMEPWVNTPENFDGPIDRALQFKRTW